STTRVARRTILRSSVPRLLPCRKAYHRIGAMCGCMSEFSERGWPIDFPRVTEYCHAESVNLDGCSPANWIRDCHAPAPPYPLVLSLCCRALLTSCDSPTIVQLKLKTRP